LQLVHCTYATIWREHIPGKNVGKKTLSNSFLTSGPSKTLMN